MFSWHVFLWDWRLMLTHWGLVTPGRRQAINWTDAELLIGPLGTNLSETLIEIHAFSFKKMHLQMSAICLGFNVCSKDCTDSIVIRIWFLKRLQNLVISASNFLNAAFHTYMWMWGIPLFSISHFLTPCDWKMGTTVNHRAKYTIHHNDINEGMLYWTLIHDLWVYMWFLQGQIH